MDILLCALESVDQDIFRIKGAIEIISAECKSVTCADDLQSVAASKAALQRIANIVSAYSTNFRIKINLTKRRTLMVQFGLETTEENDPTIIVYTEG